MMMTGCKWLDIWMSVIVERFEQAVEYPLAFERHAYMTGVVGTPSSSVL